MNETLRNELEKIIITNYHCGKIDAYYAFINNCFVEKNDRPKMRKACKNAGYKCYFPVYPGGIANIVKM